MKLAFNFLQGASLLPFLITEDAIQVYSCLRVFRVSPTKPIIMYKIVCFFLIVMPIVCLCESTTTEKPPVTEKPVTTLYNPEDSKQNLQTVQHGAYQGLLT